MKKIIKVLSILGAVFALIVGVVYGANSFPGGASSITQGKTSRFNESNYVAITIDAMAGNITEINITAPSQTVQWQGYYGEVTGDIVLDDAANNTFYAWTETEPQGEVYASKNSTIDWVDVVCFNYTGAGGSYGPTNVTSHNVTYWENFYNMSPNQQDGINETFANGSISNGAQHNLFYVGNNLISAGSCPAIDTYELNSASGTNFQQVLLADNSSLIFATILENDLLNNETDNPGYDNVTHDFQLLVAEDGKGNNDYVTPYYFWLELG